MQWGVPDVIGNPQALNYYSYANGNPIMLSDPSGLRALTSSEQTYYNDTISQVNQLYQMGKGDVGLQMYNNLQGLLREIAAIPTGGGGNYVGGGGGGGGSTVTQTPAVTKSQAVGYTQIAASTPAPSGGSGGGYVEGVAAVAFGGSISYGFSGASYGASTLNPFSLTREGLMSQAKDPELLKIINDVFRAGGKIPGGTAGAARYTALTSELVGNSNHWIKTSQSITRLTNYLNNAKGAVADLQAARAMLADLRAAQSAIIEAGIVVNLLTNPAYK